MLGNQHGQADLLRLLLLSTVILVGVDGKTLKTIKTIETIKTKGQNDLEISSEDIFSIRDEGKVILVKSYTQLVKSIDFKTIENELNRIESKLAKANPDFKQNFMVVSENSEFFISQFRNSPAANFLACNAFGEAITVQSMIENRVKIDRELMFTDYIILNKEKILCMIHGVSWTDTMCIKQIFSTALVLGLKTPTNSTREYFSKLTSMQLENHVLYIYINASNIWFDNSHSYVICKKDSVTPNQKDSNKVMRVKQYSLIGNVLTKWVNQLNEKYFSALDSFSLLATKQTDIKSIQNIELCKEIVDLQPFQCNSEIQFPTEILSHFLQLNFVQIHKADELLMKVFKFITTNCNEKNKHMEVGQLVQVLKVLKKDLEDKWEIESAISEHFSIMVSSTSENWDLKKCVQDTVHNKISDLESAFYVYLGHNLKIKALKAASNVLKLDQVPRRIKMV